MREETQEGQRERQGEAERLKVKEAEIKHEGLPQPHSCLLWEEVVVVCGAGVRARSALVPFQPTPRLGPLLVLTLETHRHCWSLLLGLGAVLSHRQGPALRSQCHPLGRPCQAPPP